MPRKVRFGVYEFDVNTGELSKGGTPIRLQEQPCHVLACLIEHAGEIVTREQLRERIWAKDIFVDFDQSLNKAVNRLREALNDDAGQPRYIETVPRRGYRFVAPIGETAPAQPPVVHPPAPQRLGFPGLALVGCGIAAACVILAVALPPKLRTPSPADPVRITTSGSATQPAFSKDGKLLAYTSLDSRGIPHVWARPAAGGEAFQVTNGSAGESQPNFSANGRTIAFRSEMDGGGVYVIPVPEGEPQLVAKGARWPRFSPDGDQLFCFSKDSHGMLMSTLGGVPQVMPEPFETRFVFPGYPAVPVWDLDGGRMLYLGPESSGGRVLWWIEEPTHDTSRVDVNLHDFRGRWGLVPLVHAFDRTRDDRHWIVYSAPTGHTRSLFRVAVNPNGEILGKAEQLTSGSEFVPDATASSDGKLAFTAVTLNEQIYEIPTMAEAGEQGGRVSKVTEEGFRTHSPSISRDGRWLAYATANLRDSLGTIRIKDLVTGADRLLVDHVQAGDDDFLSISPDGSTVMYSHAGNTKGAPPACSVVPATGGPPQRVAESCSEPRGFSSDASIVLIQRLCNVGTPDQVIVVDLRSKREREFLADPRKNFYHAFFSWDDRWVVFKTAEHQQPDYGDQILIAPVRDGMPAGEREWISITDARGIKDKAQFSPDGDKIYFISDSDGYRCLWSQALNHTNKQPQGRPYAVRHFHGAEGRFMLDFYQHWVGLYATTLSVSRGRIVTNLADVRSDIWMLQLH